MDVSFKKYELIFRFVAGTSRGSLTSKTSYFIFVKDDGHTGIGECSFIPALTPDDPFAIEDKLNSVLQMLKAGNKPDELDLKKWPALNFALETAFLDLQSKGNKILFPSAFTKSLKPIPINGLVWMGDEAFMLQQVEEKINKGFSCIKLKVGALDFESELNILRKIRNQYGQDLEIRLDANGAFLDADALVKLEKLAAFKIHSLEQPIKAGQLPLMKEICAHSPIPIALDEELIGYFSIDKKVEMLHFIKPQFIILKPGLHGGFKHAQEWIDAANKEKIGWWITSALESNIGLNAIAQFAAQVAPQKVHGLGTGQLFHNNIPSPLEIREGHLIYNSQKMWDLTVLNENTPKHKD